MLGRVISHYRVVEKLGEGGMGMVYLAQDLTLGRSVALKFLSLSLGINDSYRQRFMHEARAASTLDHVNICTIFEIGETEEGLLFISMAYCEGETLKEKMNRGPLPLGEAVDVCVQVAQGLDHAHGHGIVHRDIKPSNLIITNHGIVKIVDFGLAKLSGQPGLTKPGMIVGTPAYLSPEQSRGEEVDHRSDIWSLGVLLYEMVVGRLPFYGPYEAATLHSILTESLPPITRDIPPGLKSVIEGALRKEQDFRYQSASQMATDLQATRSQIKAEPSPFQFLPGAHIAANRVSVSGLTPTIAVLPFINMTSDQENEYFSDGLTEELINALSHLPNLRVVSRTSSFQFKGRPDNVKRIGEQLNVASVLEGSVRKVGNRVRISAQLVNVSDGFHIWSERFDREMKDIFEVQDEIARTIADKLKVRLTPSKDLALIKRQTENLEAFNLYLKGRYYWNKRNSEAFAKAFEYFQKAIEEDPDYAPPYTGLTDYYVALAGFGLVPPVTHAWPQAKAAALRALDLDPTLAEGHAALAAVQMFCEWNRPEAEQSFIRAIELNASLTWARVMYALCLTQTGQVEKAKRQATLAMEIDPFSIPTNTGYAAIFYYAREYDQAIKLFTNLLEFDEQNMEACALLGLSYQERGIYEKAIETHQMGLARSGNNPLLLGALGGVYGKAGMSDLALGVERQLSDLSKRRHIPPTAWVFLAAGRGDIDGAFMWLEKAAEDREPLLCYLAVAPWYDPLRSDPRYHAMLEKVGLAGRDRSSAETAMIPKHNQG